MNKKYLFIGNRKSPLALHRFGIISDLVSDGCDFYDRIGLIFLDKSNLNIENVYSWPKMIAHYSRLGHIYSLIQVCIYIMTHRVEVVFFHGVSRQLLCLVPRLTGVKTVSIPQGSDINQQFRGIHKCLTKELLSSSSMIFAKSEGMRKRVMEVCGNRNVQLINWGLSPEFEKYSFVEEPVHDERKYTIISLRSFKPIYNIEIIFQAISELKNEGVQLHFIFVSLTEPNSKSELPGCIDEMHFSISSEQICRLLQRSDVTVSVPAYDGFSTTIIESLMLGVYPIISNIKAYSGEFENPLLCRKISNIDVQSLKDALLDVFNNLSSIRATRKYRKNYAINEYASDGQIVKISNALELL